MSFQVDIFVVASKDWDTFYLDGANLQMQTHLAPKIMYQK